MSEQDIEIFKLYETPFPSSRTGAIYNAFSYPTKISAEAEAIFIACHTKIGDTILDPFGGSGTTGIAVKLAAKPTINMISMADKMGLYPKWGERSATIYELSPIGTMLGDVLCNTNPIEFEAAAKLLIENVTKELNAIYSIIDNDGKVSNIRHVIWSDVISCPYCSDEISYAESCITYNPLTISEVATCPKCGKQFHVTSEMHVIEEFFDKVLNCKYTRRKRIPYKIYGITDKKKWSRLCTSTDILNIRRNLSALDLSDFPSEKIKWGLLYRKGYHSGMTHLHHFYTERNAYVMNYLWKKINTFPVSIQAALRIFVLSYNSSHSTLMTRVVAKKNSTDFVLTGAQTGVLYISNLPVEKNILLGLGRKIKTFKEALSLTACSKSEVKFVNGSSLNLNLDNSSIDYVFTDPPFGDFIPYSEINQLNELWLGKLTDVKDEVIINPVQDKDISVYEALMNGVFAEVSRTLKEASWATVVFHSAKAEIWQALNRVFTRNGLTPYKAAILDKVQSTFKQTNSYVTVKGDPLILLSKQQITTEREYKTSSDVLNSVIKAIPLSGSSKNIATKRYSEYIRLCMENGITVELNANSPELHESTI